MATYVILSKFSSSALREPKDLKRLAQTVSDTIENECPAVTWKDSYATMGRFDVVDVVDSGDPQQVGKAAMIIRSYGHATTETLPATPWQQFLSSL
ncbi:MAG TPA: GYD domain-containing protein [Gammaproteobacteria bacterium]|nr:GYD domain-containing protein [Gammaproteobacteria bacterium]